MIRKRINIPPTASPIMAQVSKPANQLSIASVQKLMISEKTVNFKNHINTEIFYMLLFASVQMSECTN